MIEELHVTAGPPVLKQRMETRARLARCLTAIARGESPEVSPEAVAEALGGEAGEAWWGLAHALKALGMAVRWEPAVAAADGNPSRFQDAARYTASRALEAERHAPWGVDLEEGLEMLARLERFAEVRHAAELLRRVPMRLPVTNLFDRSQRRGGRVVEQACPRQAPVVLVRFTLDDEAVSWPMALQPDRAYRLGAHVTMAQWPESCNRLVIDFCTTVPQSVLERDRIIIPRGLESGEAYLVPRASLQPNASVQLVPAASFVAADASEEPAALVGQTSLRVTTFDAGALDSGQPMVAKRILELLSELDARIPSLPPQDRRDVTLLLGATARFTASTCDRKDLVGLNEVGFQAKLKEAYLQDPLIGRRIQEGPKLGGGVTDLVLGRIVNELKVTHTRVDPGDVDRLTGQPTQYAVANDCPISVLSILDDSPKTEPPGVQSNYMRWVYRSLHGLPAPQVPSMVAVVVIPIGFPRPSDWQKRS